MDYFRFVLGTIFILILCLLFNSEVGIQEKRVSCLAVPVIIETPYVNTSKPTTGTYIRPIQYIGFVNGEKEFRAKLQCPCIRLLEGSGKHVLADLPYITKKSEDEGAREIIKDIGHSLSDTIIHDSERFLAQCRRILKDMCKELYREKEPELEDAVKYLQDGINDLLGGYISIFLAEGKLSPLVFMPQKDPDNMRFSLVDKENRRIVFPYSFLPFMLEEGSEKASMMLSHMFIDILFSMSPKPISSYIQNVITRKIDRSNMLRTYLSSIQKQEESLYHILSNAEDSSISTLLKEEIKKITKPIDKISSLYMTNYSHHDVYFHDFEKAWLALKECLTKDSPKISYYQIIQKWAYVFDGVNQMSSIITKIIPSRYMEEYEQYSNEINRIIKRIIYRYGVQNIPLVGSPSPKKDTIVCKIKIIPRSLSKKEIWDEIEKCHPYTLIVFFDYPENEKNVKKVAGFFTMNPVKIGSHAYQRASEWNCPYVFFPEAEEFLQEIDSCWVELKRVGKHFELSRLLNGEIIQEELDRANTLPKIPVVRNTRPQLSPEYAQNPCVPVASQQSVNPNFEKPSLLSEKSRRLNLLSKYLDEKSTWQIPESMQITYGVYEEVLDTKLTELINFYEQRELIAFFREMLNIGSMEKITLRDLLFKVYQTAYPSFEGDQIDSMMLLNKSNRDALFHSVKKIFEVLVIPETLSDCIIAYVDKTFVSEQNKKRFEVLKNELLDMCISKETIRTLFVDDEGVPIKDVIALGNDVELMIIPKKIHDIVIDMLQHRQRAPLFESNVEERFFRKFLKLSKIIQQEKDCDTWAQEFQLIIVPKIFAESIYALIKGHYEKYLIARSAMMCEDGFIRTFAGIYHSEPSIPLHNREALLDAVKLVWSSLWTEQAIEYLHEVNISPLINTAGVLIMEMIPVQKGGVVLTHVAVGGDRGQDENFGQAIGDVIATKGPTAEVVNPQGDGDTHERWIFKYDAGELHLERQASKKFDGGKIEFSNVLTNGEIKRIKQMSNVITLVYGIPQDIEWGFYEGKLYLFQTRPRPRCYDPGLLDTINTLLFPLIESADIGYVKEILDLLQQEDIEGLIKKFYEVQKLDALLSPEKILSLLCAHAIEMLVEQLKVIEHIKIKGVKGETKKEAKLINEIKINSLEQGREEKMQWLANELLTIYEQNKGFIQINISRALEVLTDYIPEERIEKVFMNKKLGAMHPVHIAVASILMQHGKIKEAIEIYRNEDGDNGLCRSKGMKNSLNNGRKWGFIILVDDMLNNRNIEFVEYKSSVERIVWVLSDLSKDENQYIRKAAETLLERISTVGKEVSNVQLPILKEKKIPQLPLYAQSICLCA